MRSEFIFMIPAMPFLIFRTAFLSSHPHLPATNDSSRLSDRRKKSDQAFAQIFIFARDESWKKMKLFASVNISSFATLHNSSFEASVFFFFHNFFFHEKRLSSELFSYLYFRTAMGQEHARGIRDSGTEKWLRCLESWCSKAFFIFHEKGLNKYSMALEKLQK